MSYQFSITADNLAILKEDEDPIIMAMQEVTDVFFIDDPSGESEVQQFSPTLEFWKAVIETNTLTSRIAEYHDHADAYGLEEFAPDIREFGPISIPNLPKYEERIIWSLFYRLLDLRQDTNRVYADYPALRRLVRTAHVEAGQEVPEYLTEWRYEH